MNSKTAKSVAACFAVALSCAALATPALKETTVADHAAVSRRAAAEGMVLIKNDGALPLDKETPVALFGATDEYLPGGGGSSKVKPVRVVDIPAGLREAGFTVDPASRDTAVFVVARKSGESGDVRAEAFDLSPGELDELAKVKAAGFRRIVVVFNSGHAMNLRPLRDDPAVGAILWTWFPGGEGGAAVADVLSGAVNPSGRLAATFAEKVGDYASDAGFAESRAYVPYEDDIFVGYRYFETIPGAKEKVVYPFGHGLSYTTWEVEVLKCCQCENVANANVANDQLELEIGTVNNSTMATFVKVRVANTGKVAGRHSVLCYTSQKGGKAEHPALELRAYAKTGLLAPGEGETLELSFARDDLAYFDDEGASGHMGSWVVDSGRYSVLVGGSVQDVVEAGSFEVAEQAVVSSPGLKLQCDRLARRLRADGSRTAAPVAYPGAKGLSQGKKPRAKPLKKATVTLFDVADGKATMDQLLDQMTIDEMLHLLYGHQKHDPSGTGSIGDLAKFGVSAAQTCDGPAGVRRATPSSYIPCAALLAGTFDAKLIEEVGAVIGEEAAEADFDILLAPGLCIQRHPLCGRNFEYFSEDPLVAGVSAGAYVRGVQSQGVGATVKHFAGNNRETTRKFESDIVSERAFREIYLRGFERAISIGKPWAVMTSYNSVNGFNAGAHHGLMSGMLRGEWGFDGVAMTDWWTSAPMWREIAAGNDVKMPDDRPTPTEKKLFKVGDGAKETATALEYRGGFLSYDAVRESARRVCELVMKTRRFARERKAHHLE